MSTQNGNENDKKEQLLLPLLSLNDTSYSYLPVKDTAIDKTLIDTLDSAVIVLDNDLNIVVMNKAAEKRWGVRSRDVVGTGYLSLHLRSLEKEFSLNLKKVLKGKEPVNIKELQLILPDNISRFYDLNYVPLIDKNGEVQGVLSVTKDVTSQVSQDSQYQEAKKLLIKLSEELRNKDDEISSLKENLGNQYTFHRLVGNNYLMQKLYALIKRVAATDTTVLLTGETGTGKELAAKAIHYNSPRKDNAFVAVNCAALTESLLESELFGHVKGSFTGAIRDKRGKFELANRGTLFLDEVGDLPITTQVKLLRVLQEREIERVGDEKTIPLDIRVIAATNQDLTQLIKEGKFRKDLYYRLGVVTLKMPSLTEKVEDIPLLADHFIKKFSSKFNKPIRGIAPYALHKLMLYSWPGNVRELEGVIEKAIIMEDSNSITDVDVAIRKEDSYYLLPPKESKESFPSYDEIVKNIAAYEHEYFIALFKRFKGKVTAIADFTDLSRRSIFNKMKKFGIDKKLFK